MDEDLRFKYFDDASVLEIVNLVSIGLASHNAKLHVSSNIATHNQFIPNKSLKSQTYLENIQNWSDAQKMELNTKKCKIMIFNFTKNYQFTTDIELKGELLEMIE